jgi:hypothetical protein
MIKIGMKSFELYGRYVPSILLSLPMSFPSLTHLRLHINPTMISHLLLLKSLTHLGLTISKCVEPKVVLIALQPLAAILTQLALVGCTTSDPLSDGDLSDYHFMSYLLPFRSLTSLSIHLSPKSDIELHFMDMTSSFIDQHWNKLDAGSIHLYATHLDLVRLLRGFLSLSSTPLLPSADASIIVSSNSTGNDNCDIGSRSNNDKNDSSVGIQLWPGLDGLDQFLEHMENASLLIPSSSSTSTSLPKSISSDARGIPTISLRCQLHYQKGEAEAVQSFERDMNNRVKLRNYINMSSFTIHVPVRW